MGGTAPYYDNVRWCGGRIPTELFPGTFVVQQDGSGGGYGSTLIGNATTPNNLVVTGSSLTSLSQSLAAQPTLRLTDNELTLGYAGNTTTSGSVVATRGAVTIGPTTHLIGTGSYTYGVQGKLINNGYIATTGGNGIIQCGVLAQLDLSNSLGIAAGSQVTALWVDCGAAVGMVTGSAIDVSTFYQNIGRITGNLYFL